MRRFAFLCGSMLLAVVTSRAQEAVTYEGQAAVKFRTTQGKSMTVPYLDYHGSPAFRFAMYVPSGWGWGQGPRAFLYVAKERVTLHVYSPPRPEWSFDVPRSEVRLSADGGGVMLKRPHREKLSTLCQKEGEETDFCGTEGEEQRELVGFILRTVNDFDGAVQQFEKQTASLRPAAPAPAQSEAVRPPPPLPPPTLALALQPANVQVYVDDIFKGMTSAEGRLVVEGLAPGAHRVRMNLIGYTEAARTVELKAGETAAIEAKLEPAGPKPLALAEIEEALSNGLPPKGITKLVNQYGVDFTLTKPIEQRLRDKGADSDLLVAIATNKK